MKKQLSIGDAPIKYLLKFYIPLMITFKQSDEVEEWFHHSFILTKTKIHKSKSWTIVNDYNPYVSRVRCLGLSAKILKKNTVMKLLKNLINNNYYISLNLDFFYLKNSFAFQKLHFNHQILLYGYDDEKERIYLCGYCFGSKIRCIEIDTNSFLNSFFSCNHNNVWVYKRRKKKKINFNMKSFYLGIKSYATSTYPLIYQIRTKNFSFSNKERYGIDVHIELKTKLINDINDEKSDIKLRIYCYMEMAQCMVIRLDYIRKNKLLKDIDKIIYGFNELKKKYDIMLRLYMKYMITNDKNILCKVIDIEDELLKEEKNLYTNLYNKIQQQYSFK